MELVSLPGETVGGAVISEQPVAPSFFQQCMAFAYGAVIYHHLPIGITANPVHLAIEGNT
jgi:hypothetical protein